MSRNPGPLCARCGCYRDEHRSTITYEWRVEHAECLCCSECSEYEPSGDDDSRTIEAEP